MGYLCNRNLSVAELYTISPTYCSKTNCVTCIASREQHKYLAELGPKLFVQTFPQL